jgi:hypothetical protein
MSQLNGKQSSVNSPVGQSSFGKTLIEIFVNPKPAFAAVKLNFSWSWLVLALQLLTFAGVLFWFYQGLTPQWLVEQQLLHSPELSPAEIEQSKAMLGQMANAMPMVAPVFGAITLVIIMALNAFYLHIYGKMAGLKESFGGWFSLTVWSQMPLIPNMIGFAALILASTTPDMPLSAINYASVNQLLFNQAIGDQYYTLLESISLFTFWQIALTAVGIQQWTAQSFGKALAIAAAPYAVVYGIWALIA